ncbi:hypothetical protein LPJ66_005026 [Kickxella alabastrina]|uniref:Uncharacterized protein n=1 Tax=Kickxella alabastrina TaxID=61397 RepID=A0ACC1IJM4_9FUNG|nr:hypothetical protein LPJ66_005026 [Kickxella alabastrina]
MVIPWHCQANCVPRQDSDLHLYCPERWQCTIRRQLLGSKLEQGQTVILLIGSQNVSFVVVSTTRETRETSESQQECAANGVVGRETQFTIIKGGSDQNMWDKVPGYEPEAANLVSEVRSYFNNKDKFQHLCINPLQSVCVTGISGSGKTTIINAALERLEYPVIYGNLSDIIVNATSTDFADEYISMALADLANRASASAPSVIVLDRIDTLNDKELTEELTGLNDQFCKFGENIPADVFLVLESNVEAADMPAGAKRCDALQHCQLVPVPTLPRREEIVHSIMRRLMAAAAAGSGKQAMASDAEIDALSRRVANSTAGYVARDINALCRQAFLRMLSERNPRDVKTNGVDALAADLSQLNLQPGEAIAQRSVGQAGTCQVDTLPSWSQFAASLQAVRPSQQMEFEGVRPTKRWSDIGGYDTIKQSLQRFMRLATTENSSSLGINPPSGILLYGPSGCGKTAMALAMIGESACNVIYIRGSELFSKYLGETEARLRRLFRAARAAAPCIVFMDEIDSIAAKREWSSVESGGPALRVLSTLLNEMDGVHETRGVIAVGCTNQLDRIDDAIVRPGRFDQLVKVNMPSLQDRVGILQTLGINSPLNEDVCIDELAQMTEGYSGAGLEQLFREAGLAAMRQNQSADAFSMSDFMSAFDRISGA